MQIGHTGTAKRPGNALDNRAPEFAAALRHARAVTACRCRPPRHREVAPGRRPSSRQAASCVVARSGSPEYRRFSAVSRPRRHPRDPQDAGRS